MHKIEKITVENFWGEFNFTVKVNEDVTFFIGVNGTGKTTLINLVAASLLADFETLDKIPFKKIEIQLKGKANAKGPTITVRKKLTAQSPIPSIDYELQQSPNSKGVNRSGIAGGSNS